MQGSTAGQRGPHSSERLGHNPSQIRALRDHPFPTHGPGAVGMWVKLLVEAFRRVLAWCRRLWDWACWLGAQAWLLDPSLAGGTQTVDSPPGLSSGPCEAPLGRR